MFMTGEGCAGRCDDMPPAALWRDNIMNAKRNGTFGQIRAVAVALLLLGLAACASPFKADVSRFQYQLPPPAGQSFVVVPSNPDLKGSIEFGYYAQLVEQQLINQGYARAATPEQATMLVTFDYGVDTGRERVRSWGGSSWGAWGPGWGPGWGGAGWRRGGWGWGGGWGYGWYDPWFDGGVESYTVFTSGINMTIDRKADSQRLFEGRAQAVSTSNQLQHLVPNLVEAMFTGFPGNSGETVRISIAPENKKTVSTAAPQNAPAASY